MPGFPHTSLEAGIITAHSSIISQERVGRKWGWGGGGGGLHQSSTVKGVGP